MDSNHEMLQMKFLSELMFIDFVQEITQKILQRSKVIDDEVFWISLAVREAVINAMKHGNKFDQGKYVHFSLDFKNRKIKVEVRDEGEGFDVSSVPNPLDEANLLKPSGRGIFYMRSFMDHVEYTRIGHQGTRVVMEKEVSFQAITGKKHANQDA